MEQLLCRYANLQCTVEEKQLVYKYVEADFNRCFELIRLMKMRAYKELKPEVVERKSSERIDRQMSSLEDIKPTLKKKETVGFRSLYKPLSKWGNELFEEFVDDGQNEMAEELVSSVTLFTASGFLGLLEEYIVSPD